VDTVSPDEARKLVASNEVAVIDLRDEEGWLEGFIAGAKRVDPDSDDWKEELPQEGKLLIVCMDGKRSAEVASELRDEDREAVSLDGGMKAWMSDGKPTQPSTDYDPGPEEIPEGEGEGQAGGEDAPPEEEAQAAGDTPQDRIDDN
jgi:rhodanese-related sulfurtransferase